MAPEQLERPLEVDHRADVYSLGVVFYEMLTGELPLGRFNRPSKSVRVDVRLDHVVLRALEREPERRYQHVSEIGSELKSLHGVAAVTLLGRVRLEQPAMQEFLSGLVRPRRDDPTCLVRHLVDGNALAATGLLPSMDGARLFDRVRRQSACLGRRRRVLFWP